MLCILLISLPSDVACSVKVMIMADQDYDGSHIKGLLINFFHYFWPDLFLSGSMRSNGKLHQVDQGFAVPFS